MTHADKMTRLKEMTAHIRSRVKHSGIKARVRMSPNSGTTGMYGVQVITPSYDVKFTWNQSYEISFIAKCNNMTMVRGDEIDLDLARKLSGRNQIDLFMAL